MWIFLHIIIASLVSQVMNTDNKSTSPPCCSEKRCVCIKLEGGGIEVNCAGLGLITFPHFDSNVKSIIMRDNIISSFPNSLFLPAQLEILDISKNIIVNLNNDPFKGLANLKILNLNDNNLNYNSETFPLNVFLDLKNLHTLDITKNCKSCRAKRFRYPDAVFLHLTSLRELRLDGIQEEVLDHRFRNLKSLKTLDLSGSYDVSDTSYCEIQELSPGTFINVPNVTSLALRKCSITKISRHVFSQMKDLEILDLSYNFFLSFNILSNLTYDLQFVNIRILALDGIHCSSGVGTIIFKDDFKHLKNTNLKKLHLEHNRLQYFQQGALTNLPQTLHSLHLNHNNFAAGNFGFDLAKMVGLQYLEIGFRYNAGSWATSILLNCWDWRPPLKNSYRKIQANSYEAMAIINLPPNLRVLYMNNVNALLHFDRTEISSNNKLVRLFLQNNRFHVWNGQLRNFRHLKQLDLSNNFCSHVSKSFFNDLKNLEVLDISKNLLQESLSSDRHGLTFKGLGNLKQLNISYNILQSLPKQIFSDLYSLENLDIKFNSLAIWKVNISHMKNLQHLDLSYNKLEQFAKGTMSQINSMSNNLTINLKGNNFRCTCDTLDFLEWINNNAKIFVEFNQYECRDVHNGVLSFGDLPDRILLLKRNCSTRLGLITGTISAIVLSITVAVGGIIYRYRWKLRYFYLVTKLNFRKDQILNNRRHYEFDAFISYASEDHEFISLQLLQHLEDDLGLKLIIHERDFLAGKGIQDNIVDAVRKSNKTVVILTHSYLKSHWCKFEFNMARMESAISRGGEDVLFIVLLKSIKPSDMPLEMLDVIKSDCYIEFPDDEEGNIVFWDKLHKGIRQGDNPTHREV